MSAQTSNRCKAILYQVRVNLRSQLPPNLRYIILYAKPLLTELQLYLAQWARM